MQIIRETINRGVAIVASFIWASVDASVVLVDFRSGIPHPCIYVVHIIRGQAPCGVLVSKRSHAHGRSYASPYPFLVAEMDEPGGRAGKASLHFRNVFLPVPQQRM
jgi:hypothetical protein